MHNIQIIGVHGNGDNIFAMTFPSDHVISNSVEKKSVGPLRHTDTQTLASAYPAAENVTHTVRNEDRRISDLGVHFVISGLSLVGCLQTL